MHCSFKSNNGKKDFPLGAEAVGVVVKLGSDTGDLKVSYHLYSIGGSSSITEQPGMPLSDDENMYVPK